MVINVTMLILAAIGSLALIVVACALSSSLPNGILGGLCTWGLARELSRLKRP